MLKKHTIAEENEKGAQDAERHPMLNCSSDVPFGARALERGVQVEGIWVSSSETLNQIPREFARPTATSRPATPMTGSPLKKASLIDSSDLPQPFPRYPSASHGTSPSKPVDDNATSNDEATGDSSDAPRASQQSYHSVATYIEPRNSQDPGPRQSRQWFGPRSSWVTKPISYKRGSGISQGRLCQATVRAQDKTDPCPSFSQKPIVNPPKTSDGDLADFSTSN